MLDARQVAAVKVGLRMLEEVLSFERRKTSCLVDYEKADIGDNGLKRNVEYREIKSSPELQSSL